LHEDRRRFIDQNTHDFLLPMALQVGCVRRILSVAATSLPLALRGDPRVGADKRPVFFISSFEARSGESACLVRGDAEAKASRRFAFRGGANSSRPTDPQIAHIAYTAVQLDIEAAKQALDNRKTRTSEPLPNGWSPITRQ
jgi:hypothetical protein